MILSDIQCYVALGVIDNMVKNELLQHREIVNNNFQQLNKYNYKLIEDYVP